MSLIYSAVINIVQSKRKCPKCGNTQTVPRDRKNETVICKVCGADIPPPPK